MSGITRYETFSQAWGRETRMTELIGAHVSPRGMDTRERQWVQFTITDPLSFPVRAAGRQFHDVIGILEATSLVGQFNVPELFTHRVKKFAQFTDGGVFHGSYGARVHARLVDLVELLKRDPFTRQAVLTIFDSRSDLGASKKDIPCTISIQFLRDREYLGMRVTMRSNDLWLGTPYDFVQFAVLQASIAQAVGLKVGNYVHAAGSLHLYERDVEAWRKVEGTVDSPSMPFPLWDPRLEDIDGISKRARDLAFGQIEPETEFEQWALELL